jgi:hypothetical protein
MGWQIKRCRSGGTGSAASQPSTGGTTAAQPRTGPPSGTEACIRSGPTRRCTISFATGTLGLTAGSHVKSFTLRRGRKITRSSASVRGREVELHTRTRAPAGKYLLTIWTRHGTRQQLLRQLTVQLH